MLQVIVLILLDCLLPKVIGPCKPEFLVTSTIGEHENVNYSIMEDVQEIRTILKRKNACEATCNRGEFESHFLVFHLLKTQLNVTVYNIKKQTPNNSVLCSQD